MQVFINSVGFQSQEEPPVLLEMRTSVSSIKIWQTSRYT